MRKYLKEGQYSYQQQELLGKGSFGKVFRGYDHTNSRWVAIKAIHLEVIQFHGQQMKTIVCNQISVMRKFTTKMKQKPCSYLVRHYDCFRTDTYVYIIMEICQEGTLSSYIEKGALTEEQTKNIIKQIVQGLAYLEEMSICHRDLKPDNIFISSQFNNGVNQIYYKIGDFGFASQKQSFNETLGTYPFMAPQIFNKEDYTTRVDVWSLGIITYRLLFQQMYFMGNNKWEIEEKVKNSVFSLTPEKKSKISKEMQHFLSSCLTKDKEKRPKASELLQLDLFKVNEANLDVIFEALEHELLFSQLLRSMAEEICGFGIATNRNTEFIQIYLLKKAFAAINLLSYSLVNKQNYLNVPNQMFNVLGKEEHQSELKQLLDKVEKQNILMSTVFRDKHSEFCKYIKKYRENEIEAIQNITRAEEIYSDINMEVFKAQLKKWINTLENQSGYENLKLKCEKLYEVS